MGAITLLEELLAAGTSPTSTSGASMERSPERGEMLTYTINALLVR